jgi:1-phosphatidylinositol-4-phosphate 5-kinase
MHPFLLYGALGFVLQRLMQSWGVWCDADVDACTQLGGSPMQPRGDDLYWRATSSLIRGMHAALSVVEYRELADTGAEIDAATVGDDFARVEIYGTLEQQASPQKRRRDRDTTFKVYAGPAFARLRKLYGITSRELLQSFPQHGQPLIEFAANSKSPQRFFFSHDGKFMVKTMSETELRSLLRFLKDYSRHLRAHPGSLISRFYGAFRSNGVNFVLTSNVFDTRRPIEERYDLKGSYVGRRSRKDPDAVLPPTAVLKDLDLAECRGRPLCIGIGRKRSLMRTLRADADFLQQLGIMDYSLLVGVERKRGWVSIPGLGARLIWWALSGAVTGALNLVGVVPSPGGQLPLAYGGGTLHMAIIDVLQRYTVRKDLETKAKGIVYDKHGISSVPPQEYSERFLRFIDEHVN